MALNTQKETLLAAKLKDYQKVAIAFSGGIDSSYLLKIALNTLGAENVLAVVVNSELFADQEFDHAIALAEAMGASVIGLSMQELADENIAANTPMSWYYSKKLLYQTIIAAVAEKGFATVLDGMIMDDLADFRPGLKARDELNVQSPLQAVELTKVEIRELAKANGITNWNKAASCSIASRFPYGNKLTQPAVDLAFQSEAYLRDTLGFPVVRVRIHDKLARIELPATDLPQAFEQKAAINQQLKEFGFDYVTFDLAPFKSGHMNDVLTAEQKAV